MFAPSFRSALRLLAEPAIDDDALQQLAALFRSGSSVKLAAQFADALVDTLPTPGDKEFIPIAERLGCRLAYICIRMGHPSFRAQFDNLARYFQAVTLLRRAQVALELKQCVPHTHVITTCLGRLDAYELTVHAVRDMLLEEVPAPALFACLLERIIVAAADDQKLCERLSAFAAKHCDRQKVRRIRQTIASTAHEGMCDPWEPDVPEPAARRLERANPFELVPLLVRLPTTGRLVDDLSEVRFLGPLTRNPRFKRTAERIGEELFASR